jgi:hypothetical protein
MGLRLPIYRAMPLPSWDQLVNGFVALRIVGPMLRYSDPLSFVPILHSWPGCLLFIGPVTWPYYSKGLGFRYMRQVGRLRGARGSIRMCY